MRKTLRIAVAYMKLSFSSLLEKRLTTFIWALVGFSYSFSSMYIWYMVSRQNGTVGSVETSQIFSYFAFRFLLWYVIGGTFHWMISDGIKNGTLSNILLKPQPAFLSSIAWEQGWKVFGLLLCLPLFVALLMIFPDPALLSSPIVYLISIPSLIFGAIIFGCFQVLVASSTFWWQSYEGADSLYRVTSDFFGGNFIPLALLPFALRNISNMLPFRYSIAFSAELLARTLDTSQIISGYAWQIGWTVVMLYITKLVISAGLRKYESFGN